MSVDRYNFDIPNESFVVVCEDGEYVHYSDYEDLLDKYFEICAAINKLHWSIQ